MISRWVLAPLVLLTFAARSREETLGFHATSGTSLVRTLKQSTDTELDSMAMTLNGEPVPDELFGDADIRMHREDDYVVSDSFEVVEGGEVRRLRRTFDALAGKQTTHFSGPDGESDEESEYASELEGKTVVFTWNAASGEFEVGYAEGAQGDGALLDALEEDMDLRGFLPAAAVQEGAEWQVDVQTFGYALDPGRDLALKDTEGEEDESDQDEQMRANLTGTVKARYQEARLEDGVRQAVILLEAETRTYSEEELSAEEVPEGANGKGRVEVSFELHGELRWDLEHGHALSLELEGENALTMTQTASGEMEGESMEQVQTMTFSGVLHGSMRFERK